MNLSAIAPTEILLRLLVAFAVGAVIGFERERQHRPAGLRTHILVAIAAALFTMISVVAAGPNNDPGRIAAQVVTGIGFLGAGTIMRHGSTVKGLTTAASLWMAAALGLAVGYGWYVAAVAAALLAFIVLMFVKYAEELIARGEATVAFAVTAQPGHNPLPAVMATVRAVGGELQEVKLGPETAVEGLHFIITAVAPTGCNVETLTRALQATEGVRDVESTR
jgi:putative Mg2+ transporter-C (MgtC) family protein